MPEVRILSWTNEEICSDALPMIGFEHYTANDYKLVFFQNQQKRKQISSSNRKSFDNEAKNGENTRSIPNA